MCNSNNKKNTMHGSYVGITRIRYKGMFSACDSLIYGTPPF